MRKSNFQKSASLAPFAWVSASYFAHIGFFNPYLPLWLKHLGQPLWAIAVLASVQSVTRVFMPYVWGWLADHTGKPVLCMRIGATAALASALGLWAYGSLSTPSFAGLVLGLLLLFMPTSAIIPTSEGLLTQRMQATPEGFSAQRYGRLRMWGSLGFLLTVLGAGSVFERFGMQAFLPIAVLSLVFVVASVWTLPNFEVPSVKQLGEAAPMWPVLRQAANTWFFVSVFLHVLAHISLYAFLSLWLDANGYSKGVIGALWALGVAVEIAVLFGQGRVLPRLSWPGWLVLCGAVTVLRMALLGFGVGSLWLLVLAQCLHGLTFATHHTAVIAFISERAPAQLAGRFQALYAVIGYGLSGVLGGFAGGWLSERFGLQAVFVAAALVAVAATLASERLRRLNH